MPTEFQKLAEAWATEVRELDIKSVEAIKAHAEAFFKGAIGKSVIFISGCQKVRYGHLETAQKAAQHMEGKTGDSFDCYQCRLCDDAWHIGHSRGRGN